jgi:CRP-like cAMP-binding protein
VLEESFSLMLAALRGMNRGVMESRMAIAVDAGFSASILEPYRPTSELGLVERVLFLRNSLGFAKVSVEALAEFAREMTVVRVPAGTELWDVGEPSPHLLLIWSGVVRCDTPSGQQFRLGPDSAVGGIDSVADEPRWYRAVAETDLVGLQSETADLMDVLEDHPDMGLAMLRATARILSELYDHLDRIALQSDPPGP